MSVYGEEREDKYKMFRLIQMLLEALKSDKTSDSKQIADDVEVQISDDMQDAIEDWLLMYKDQSPWLNDLDGIYSLGLAKSICRTLAIQVLCEAQAKVVDPNLDEEETAMQGADETLAETRANYLNKIFTNRIMKNLSANLEKGMATGGFIIKPYSNGEDIFVDYSMQGDFLPLAFDDDGNIIDIAFLDQFIDNGRIYTKVERQTFEQNTSSITIRNKAFVADYMEDADEYHPQPLGEEISLTVVPKWTNIESEITIDGVIKPMYGYYKVPLANNIDLNSPLGVSVFSPAKVTIQKCDEQFSRLDWEYDAGQIAIDIDSHALDIQSGYYGTYQDQDRFKNRLYRKIDLGSDDVYNAFTPGLRDANYISGLNTYLHKVEDQCGLARGTLSDAPAEARTATEIVAVKQNTYVTISSNQTALEQALKDAVDAINVYVDLYGLAADGDYDTSVEWSDSVLTDTDTELSRLLTLKREGIVSAAEVRAFYKGESLDVAQVAINEIEEAEKQKLLDDIYSKPNQNTLEE